MKHYCIYSSLFLKLNVISTLYSVWILKKRFWVGISPIDVLYVELLQLPSPCQIWAPKTIYVGKAHPPGMIFGQMPQDCRGDGNVQS